MADGRYEVKSVPAHQDYLWPPKLSCETQAWSGKRKPNRVELRCTGEVSMHCEPKKFLAMSIVCGNL